MTRARLLLLPILAFFGASSARAATLIPDSIALTGDLRDRAADLDADIQANRTEVEIRGANDNFWDAFMRTRQQQAPARIGYIPFPKRIADNGRDVTTQDFIDGLKQQLDATDVPPPAEITKDQMWDALVTAERIMSAGHMKRDDMGELPKTAAGAFTYDPDAAHPDKVLFAPMMYNKELGVYALLTPIHEFFHALRKKLTESLGRDAVKNHSDIDWEVEAFTAEYSLAMMIDPDGRIISALQQKSIVSDNFTDAEKKLVLHYKELRAAGLANRIPAWVKSLGYEEKASDPSTHGNGASHS